MTYGDLIKLADALDSGEYLQCTGSLKHGNLFCLEGVAIDLFLEGEWSDPDDGTFFKEHNGNVISGYLDDTNQEILYPLSMALGESPYSFNDTGHSFTEASVKIRKFCEGKDLEDTV